jgi:hypothetical protein
MLRYNIQEQHAYRVRVGVTTSLMWRGRIGQKGRLFHSLQRVSNIQLQYSFFYCTRHKPIRTYPLHARPFLIAAERPIQDIARSDHADIT